MRKTIKYEFWVGIFLLIAFISAAFLTLKVANIQSFSNNKSYNIEATFDNIGGLKVRSAVKLGGVVIGRVTKIGLDQQGYIPKVAMAIDETYNKIPATSSLSIKTSGLLGEQYISLNLGFDDGEGNYLEDGGEIVDTKSALVLEDLVGQFLYGDKK